MLVYHIDTLEKNRNTLPFFLILKIGTIVSQLFQVEYLIQITTSLGFLPSLNNLKALLLRDSFFI